MKHFESRLVHEASPADPATGAIVPPIHPATTFRQERVGEHKGWEYARTGNPTRAILEKAMANLEGGRRGLAFATGSAALDTVLHLLKTGDKVVAAEETYGGTRRILDHVYKGLGIDVTYVPSTEIHDWERALRRGARLVILETPSNPLLNITDLKAVTRLAHEAGALVVVDNTFASPYLQRPIESGADIVLHSATKYLGGHSDVLGGIAVTRDEPLGERLAFLQNAVGAVAGAFDAWLVLRGIKTLHLRMKAACETAMKIAKFAEEHPRVQRVHYPGLSSHPHHALATKQMRLPGAMVSFELAGPPGTAARILRSMGTLTLAESLGSVETLLCHPWSMTHASIPEEARRRLGITPNLVRVSVGIEHEEDILADLQRLLSGAPGRGARNGSPVAVTTRRTGAIRKAR